MMVFPSIVNREDTDGIVRRVSDVNVLDPTVDLDGCLGCRAYSDTRCVIVHESFLERLLTVSACT
eukprot:scaffold800_cov197-Alexandrium_tamarense.AAC.3